MYKYLFISSLPGCPILLVHNCSLQSRLVSSVSGAGKAGQPHVKE